MKKLLLILLCLPLVFSTCSKSDVAQQPQSLEDVIVGIEWCLTNDNKDGFLMSEDGKFYRTEKCQPNIHMGDWIIDCKLIKYKYTENSQEITSLFGEVTEYSDTQVSLLPHNSSDNVVFVYNLDTPDIFGCIDSTVTNYNPNADCDDGSCLFIIPGCTDSTACNYNPISNEDDGSCGYISGCTDDSALNYNSLAICDDSSCIGIGSSYQGGIIFWLDGNGGGLIAAASDQSSIAEWGCSGVFISGADGTAIGTGNQNTIDIVAGCTTSGTAADICANLTLKGYSDWFLPSRYELNKMYLNIGQGDALGLGNIGGFANPNYWSSTGYGSNYAGAQYFATGLHFGGAKTNDYYVRAVRAF
jgi:hypothetical protein